MAGHLVNNDKKQSDNEVVEVPLECAGGVFLLAGTTNNTDSRLRHGVWAAISGIILLDTVIAVYLHIRLVIDEDVMIGARFIVTYVFLAFVLRWLGRTRLACFGGACESVAAFMESTALFILFVPAYVFFSYMAASISLFPYCDAMLLRADQALGFHWLDYVHWVDSHPLIARLYTFGYSQWGPGELLLLFAALAITRQSRRLYTLLLAFIAGAFLCITIASFLPATGISAFQHMTEMHLSHVSVATGFVQVADLERLRAGTLHDINMNDFKGMVTFPSYHSCLAVLLTWGAWTVPGLRWIALFLNGVMLVATPVNGGHYLVDTISGTIIALVILRLLRGRLAAAQVPT
jgi:hypothetical protein